MNAGTAAGRRGLLATMAALVLAVALGGCFGFAGLKLSKYKLKPDAGEKSRATATITVIPPLSTEFKGGIGIPPTDQFFVLVAPPDDGSVVLPQRGRVFDPKGEFGPRGGRPLVRDDEMRDAVFSEGECEPAGTSPDGFLLFRTAQRVNDRGRVGVPTVAKLPMKQVARADTFTPGLDVFTGAFFDEDGDRSWDSGERLECSGGGFHFVAFKQVESPTPRDARDEYRARVGG